MARIQIDVPARFPFSTELDIYIEHINAGQHLGNERLVGLLNEARLRYVSSLPLKENGVDPRGFIGADLAVNYKAEARYGDRLKIEVAAQDFSKYGCDFVYRVTNRKTGQLCAIAKTAMLIFDYQTSCLKAAPENFAQLFQ
ncbi:MAG TPA: thioesterase family protein [Pseudomonadales bacterium]|jgi:4-hydroxybenzoyl-CoA thioesterase|nr:thioesterase family protein [Pseudomonadales bacterium]